MRKYLMMEMGHTAHKHFRRCSERFSKEGITRSQPWILDFLSENDGCIQRQLANHSHFDPASVTAALAAMEEQGLIRRENHPEDKRAFCVFLTEAGREKQQVVQRVHTQMEALSFAGFSQKEMLMLRDFMRRIHDNLEEEG